MTAAPTAAPPARARPGDGSIHATLGLVYASLGRKQDAVREADRAMTLAPVAEISPAATAFMGIAVEVFARVGELDAAFERMPAPTDEARAAYQARRHDLKQRLAAALARRGPPR